MYLYEIPDGRDRGEGGGVVMRLKNGLHIPSLLLRKDSVGISHKNRNKI